MSVYDSIRETMVPIHKEGYPFIVVTAILTVVLAHLWSPLGWIGAIVTVWMCFFFRDPVRVIPVRDGLLVAPADGRVSAIVASVPPAELDLGDTPRQRISIFMNVFDCHVNRSPVGGRVTRLVYTPGLFVNADLDKASEDNERSAIVIETAVAKIGVVQIAGLVARRIVSLVKEGDTLATGERFGLIRFGSRVDVYLPPGTLALVGLGQRAVAGETVLADLTASEPMRLYRKD
jgi:phosphatidylserine decarboxylase